MSNKPRTLNDRAWEKLFDKYDIYSKVQNNGFFEITSKQINEFREARLMTKFDHSINLPVLFSKNSLAILPLTRGSYYISNMEAYHTFESSNQNVIKASIPDFIHSIDLENITSEATALNVAYISGILADFTEEENLLPTVDGRMSSDKFSFNIKQKLGNSKHHIVVENAQVEIDGGYEGLNSLALIEAKNSLADDFLIRQIYYPYRLWKNRIDKEVKSIFLTYSNGIFSLYEYRFLEPENYNSLSLIKQENYTLEQEEIQLQEVLKIREDIKIVPEPIDIPFPQADSFERVINICELLNENEILSREEITYNYDFDVRQTNYYTDACRYLGLLEKNKEEGVSYFLTKKGKSVFRYTIKKRNLEFVKCILEKKAFNLVLKKYIADLELPSKEEIVSIMKESNLYEVSADSTYNRRASTISSWINWILDLTR